MCVLFASIYMRNHKSDTIYPLHSWGCIDSTWGLFTNCRPSRSWR